MASTIVNQLLLLIFLSVFASLCGKSQKLAYNATDTNYKLQKHLVELNIYFLYKYEIVVGSLCSGSVITESWILTAAHCVQPKDEKAILRDINVDIVRKPKGRLIKLGEVTKTNIRTHPLYVHKFVNYKPENDLAVMKTVVPMKLYKYLMPIKLNRHLISTGEIIPATIAGYGETAPGVIESAPRQGNVFVSICNNPYQHNLLCSSGRVTSGSGDSGGPLVGKTGQLLGVTLATYGVGRMTIYADISQYLDWIKNCTGVE